MPRHDIVPAHLAVQAMRDSGYRNAAYALAELMDNSIQAKATHVELLCGEREFQLEQRRRWRIHQTAVLDDGTGMDADTLRMALQFGNGMYLSEDKHTGIGRFGMGLPNSSISQCTRVDVWTWQDGPASAIHSYLDLGEIRNQVQTEIPEPQAQPIPGVWKAVGKSFAKTGTLVVWSNIDRCVWRTANAIIDNSEFVVGRMYRRFLEDGLVSIRMVAFDFDHPSNVSNEKFALPNDPGYLMAKTSCPAPFHVKPMFNPFGEENYEAVVTIDFRGKKHDVKIRFSVAKEEARPGTNPGSLPHRQHAAKNVGISIVRAGRELELDQSYVGKYDPVERWWGIEVEFPPSLDDLFGVTNNKQAARNFSELAKIGVKSLLESGQTMTELKQELLEEEDPRGPLLEIAQIIESRLSTMRRWLTAQTKGSRGTRRHQDHQSAEQVATDATKERQEEGYLGKSDQEEKLPADERRGLIEQTLIDEGVMVSAAKELAARTVSDGLKYVFAKADLETSAFFSVKISGGALVISLNTNHPAYEKLLDVLEEDVEGVDAESLRGRLTNALEGLRLLLAAWARYEDEQPDGTPRTRAQDARNDWGRIARQFFEREE
jgi:hypothetical protein